MFYVSVIKYDSHGGATGSYSYVTTKPMNV